MRLKTLCMVLSLLVAGPAALASDQPKEGATRIPGFNFSTSDHERKLEEQLVDLLDTASTARHFRLLTEEPHPAGSDENLELAHYVRDQFVAYGLEEVKLHRYDVLLPWPRKIAVTMVEPVEYKASLAEDGYPVDKDSYAVGADLTYLGMSASGDITADVIYAHSGNPEDYDWLEARGIDPRGKIAIVRYSNPYSYRGFKAWEAERRGVAAMIIYSDPMDDGYRKGDVFPEGPWGPESHIQRGAITYDFIVPGDPLTPGWPSVEGAKRVTREDARSVPRIPAVPMSWRDAKPILEKLGGPVAPSAWQGGLPLTYKVGPGPAKLHVEIDMDDEVRPIWVVEGRIHGSEKPDELVILGNHRDAWVYGAVDPSSGTASLLEAARVLGALARSGERPKRTLVFANWDAEEWHLTGSTEWGEQFAAELGKGAVAYLNVDSSTAGPDFSIGAVASLNPTILEVARDVIDPNSRRSLLDAWSKTVSSAEGDASAPLIENELGSGSDYTVFLNFLGVPIASMGFDGPYGVYHSQYDDLYWMEHFGDPGYRYMTAMVEVWGRLGLRLANADVIPYDFRPYASTVRSFVDSLREVSGLEEKLDLTAVSAVVDEWRREAEKLHQKTEEALTLEGETQAGTYADLNAALLKVEREFLLEYGIPDRPWFKHALYAPRYTYAAMSLPGVLEAAEAGNWDLARKQLGLLVERLAAATRATERAAALVPVR
ncbi:MAG: M28 family metallopeptidase [Acidobacteriota bacterium]|jgi:N-acetylated-alpha-linked acidic dipeptidase|nr:M28 family metallopeptidase [Acidobacteriota bacterium]